MKIGTVLENNLWKIKIYAPPKEHGPPHVHVISKGDRTEVKISLDTLEMIGKTKFSKKSVKDIIRYVHKNYQFLIEQWRIIHESKKTKS